MQSPAKVFIKKNGHLESYQFIQSPICRVGAKSVHTRPDVNEIIQIKDNKLFVKDSKMISMKSIEVVIEKRGRVKPYRFTRTGSGKYMLN